MKINYTIKQMNNKSRKGLYAYVKGSEGKGRYYKIDSINDNIQPFLVHYKKKYDDKVDSNLNKIKKYYKSKTPETFYKENKHLYGKRKMTKIFKKGISQTVISNVHQIDNLGVNEKNSQLLRKVVKDEGVINLLIQPDNLEKLKFRFNHNIKFYNEKGEVIGQDTLIGKNTLNEIVIKIQQNIMRGEYIDQSSSWKKINDLLKTNITNAKFGTIDRIEIISTFTIGK